MTVRKAAPKDLLRLVQLLRATSTGAQWSEGQFVKIFESAQASRVMLVVETTAGSEGSRDSCASVEGFLVAHLIGAECELENVVVNPTMQRRGLGKTLLEALLKRLQQVGCEAVFLEVRESNCAARGLYEKCGFREIGRRVKYYSQPQEDAVVYRFVEAAIASQMVQP